MNARTLAEPTLFDMLDFEPAPVYAGRAPLTFTRDYFHPDELRAAHRWLCDQEGKKFGSAVGAVHTWNFGITTGWVTPEGTAAHSLCLLTCSLECFGIDGHGFDYAHRREYPLSPEEVDRRPTLCTCVGGDLYQAVCSVCEWHHIGHAEGEAVEAWHDHAFPGWRDLPIAPRGTDDKKKAVWAKSVYPPEWQVPAAPILTVRSAHGTRHVPRRSPWGGFDMCAQVVAE